MNLARRLPLLLLLAAAAATAPAARGQEVRLPAQPQTLEEVLRRVAEQTGYGFGLQLPDELLAARRPVEPTTGPLPEVLAKLSGLFQCEFFSADTSGYTVVKRAPAEGVTVRLGELTLRVPPLYRSIEPGRVYLSLLAAGPTEVSLEQLAGVASDLTVVDNFGRSLLPPGPGSVRSPETLRPRPLEHPYRMELSLPDDRSVRIRTVRGRLLFYRQTRPLRVEMPLEFGEETEIPGQTHEADGVRFELGRASRVGRDVYASCRISWPRSLAVQGRGPSREPVPYLVDREGRAYRDRSGRSMTERDAVHQAVRHDMRFPAVQGEPARLVFDFWRKEDPSGELSFELKDIPLPVIEVPRSVLERRPFYAREGGGSVRFRVLDAEGRPADGEVSLGLARVQGGRPGPVRWLELLPDEKGEVVLDHLQPGTYQVTRTWRRQPGARAASAAAGRIPVEITAGKETRLPDLRLPR